MKPLSDKEMKDVYMRDIKKLTQDCQKDWSFDMMERAVIEDLERTDRIIASRKQPPPAPPKKRDSSRNLPDEMEVKGTKFRKGKPKLPRLDAAAN